MTGRRVLLAAAGHVERSPRLGRAWRRAVWATWWLDYATTRLAYGARVLLARAIGAGDDAAAEVQS